MSSKAVGAAIIGNSLFLATVTRRASGAIALEQRGTQRFELSGRGQPPLRKFREEVEEFVRVKGIRDILVRAPNAGRQYRADPFSYMIEAALSCMDFVGVELLNQATLAAWVRKSAEDFPDPPGGYYAQPTKCFVCAIEAACFNLAGGLIMQKSTGEEVR